MDPFSMSQSIIFRGRRGGGYYYYYYYCSYFFIGVSRYRKTMDPFSISIIS